MKAVLQISKRSTLYGRQITQEEAVERRNGIQYGDQYDHIDTVYRLVAVEQL
jgi:hypothetical protein